MLIDPAVLIGFITAILALLGLILRMFVQGDLLSRHTVRRESFDRVIKINESYAAKFEQQTESIRALTAVAERQEGRIDELVALLKQPHAPS